MAFGASFGAVVRLRCPRCWEVQAREKRPAGAQPYTCHKCKRTFTLEEGLAEAAREGGRGPRR
jgi:transposase-like protein